MLKINLSLSFEKASGHSLSGLGTTELLISYIYLASTGHTNTDHLAQFTKCYGSESAICAEQAVNQLSFISTRFT